MKRGMPSGAQTPDGIIFSWLYFFQSSTANTTLAMGLTGHTPTFSLEAFVKIAKRFIHSGKVKSNWSIIRKIKDFEDCFLYSNLRISFLVKLRHLLQNASIQQAPQLISCD